jgi:hypothetical protein
MVVVIQSDNDARSSHLMEIDRVITMDCDSAVSEDASDDFGHIQIAMIH